MPGTPKSRRRDGRAGAGSGSGGSSSEAAVAAAAAAAGGSGALGHSGTSTGSGGGGNGVAGNGGSLMSSSSEVLLASAFAAEAAHGHASHGSTDEVSADCAHNSAATQVIHDKRAALEVRSRRLHHQLSSTHLDMVREGLATIRTEGAVEATALLDSLREPASEAHEHHGLGKLKHLGANVRGRGKGHKDKSGGDSGEVHLTSSAAAAAASSVGAHASASGAASEAVPSAPMLRMRSEMLQLDIAALAVRKNRLEQLIRDARYAKKELKAVQEDLESKQSALHKTMLSLKKTVTLENLLSIVPDPARRDAFIDSVPDHELIAPPKRAGTMFSFSGPKTGYQTTAGGTDESLVARRENYAAARSLSLYPTIDGRRMGDPIADRYHMLMAENFTIAALADGCGWGQASADAAVVAAEAFTSYMRGFIHDIKCPSRAVRFMLRAFRVAHERIISGAGEEEMFQRGTSTMLGCVVLPLEALDSAEPPRDGARDGASPRTGRARSGSGAIRATAAPEADGAEERDGGTPGSRGGGGGGGRKGMRRRNSVSSESSVGSRSSGGSRSSSSAAAAASRRREAARQSQSSGSLHAAARAAARELAAANKSGSSALSSSGGMPPPSSSSGGLPPASAAAAERHSSSSSDRARDRRGGGGDRGGDRGATIDASAIKSERLAVQQSQPQLQLVEKEDDPGRRRALSDAPSPGSVGVDVGDDRDSAALAVATGARSSGVAAGGGSASAQVGRRGKQIAPQLGLPPGSVQPSGGSGGDHSGEDGGHSSGGGSAGGARGGRRLQRGRPRADLGGGGLSPAVANARDGERRRNTVGWGEPVHEAAAAAAAAAVAGPRKWVMIYVSLGDCKCLRWSSQTGQLRDITEGNRMNVNDTRDPGGRLGPFTETGGPDIRNVSVGVQLLDPGDIVSLVSDGVHDNLDPQYLGHGPADLGVPVKEGEDPQDWHAVLDEDAALAAKNHWTRNLMDVLSGGVASTVPGTDAHATPANIAEKLTTHAELLSQSGRQHMEDGNKQPDDPKRFPGKMDHATCLSFAVLPYAPR